MKYRIRIVGERKEGYYHSGSPYQPVALDRAQKVDRKQVDRICSTLRKLGYRVSREECK